MVQDIYIGLYRRRTRRDGERVATTEVSPETVKDGPDDLDGGQRETEVGGEGGGESVVV